MIHGLIIEETKNDIEFNLLRLYIALGHWLVSVCEIQNFATGKSWSLLELSCDNEWPIKLTIFPD